MRYGGINFKRKDPWCADSKCYLSQSKAHTVSAVCPFHVLVLLKSVRKALKVAYLLSGKHKRCSYFICNAPFLSICLQPCLNRTKSCWFKYNLHQLCLLRGSVVGPGARGIVHITHTLGQLRDTKARSLYACSVFFPAGGSIVQHLCILIVSCMTHLST